MANIDTEGPCAIAAVASTGGCPDAAVAMGESLGLGTAGLGEDVKPLVLAAARARPGP